MSGGSWDYLCYKDATEIENRSEDVKRMGERLIKEGYPEVGKRFLSFVEDLEIMMARKQMFLDKYTDVMRAVEWWDSGDSGAEVLEKAIKEVTER